MNNTGDAAEQVVRLTLDGVEVAARITGAAAKQTAALLYTLLKDQKKTRGQTSMVSMLRNHRELKICHVRADQLREFVRSARGYGVLYAVPPSQKRMKDGVIDVFVPVTSAPQAARLFERLHLADVDMDSIRTEITEAPNRPRGVTLDDEQLLAELTGSAPDTGRDDPSQNPVPARGGNASRSEPLLNSSGSSSGRTGSEPEEGRKSVRREFAQIKDNLREKESARKPAEPALRHNAPKRKKGKVK